MPAPLTGFEQTGGWTSLARETEFLQQIGAETDAVYSEAGRTVQDRPIHRLDIGNGPNTLLLVSLQHANEPSGREAALELVRDLAYATDPDTAEYLTSNRVTLVSSVNADGAFTGRDNTAGVNLNRDWFKLTQPETRAAQSVFRQAAPTLVMDLHENGLDLPDWAGNTATLAGAFPGLSALSEDLFDTVVGDVQAGGHTAGMYPLTSTPAAGAATAATAGHSLGMVSEPLLRDYSQPGWVGHTALWRVQVSRLAVRSAWRWHAANATALLAARQASIDYASLTTDPILLTNTEMIGGTPLRVDVAGYTLAEPLPAHLMTAHGIEVDGAYVSVNQPARLAIAMLCDPQSRDKVVTATRVPRIQPRPTGTWVDTYAVVGGRRRRIVEAWHVVEGQRRYIELPGQ